MLKRIIALSITALSSAVAGWLLLRWRRERQQPPAPERLIVFPLVQHTNGNGQKDRIIR